MIGLEEFCAVCHAKGVPVIVDAASEYDLKGFLARAPTSPSIAATSSSAGRPPGIVAGRKDLVRAAYLQNRGHRPRHEGRQGERRRRHGRARGLGEARPCRHPGARDGCAATLAATPGAVPRHLGYDRSRSHRQPARPAPGGRAAGLRLQRRGPRGRALGGRSSDDRTGPRSRARAISSSTPATSTPARPRSWRASS